MISTKAVNNTIIIAVKWINDVLELRTKEVPQKSSWTLIINPRTTRLFVYFHVTLEGLVTIFCQYSFDNKKYLIKAVNVE